MPVEFNITPDKILSGIGKELSQSLSRGLDKAGNFMAHQIDLSYENQGFMRRNMRGKGFELYEPTTMIAKKNRKTYPKATGKVGKKGYTQKQAQYLWAANSLEDTGKMRASIGIESDGDTIYIGAGVRYIQTHEEGGTYKGRDVPVRSSQHITEQELDIIENIITKEIAK